MSAVVVEFGANTVNVGVPGDGMPLRSMDAEAVLLSAGNNNNSGSSSSSLLLDLDVLGGHQRNNINQNQNYHYHHHSIWAASPDPNDVGDVEVAAAALRQLLWLDRLDDAVALACVVPDAVYTSDAALESWSSAIFAAGFTAFFPIQSAVAATVESGRPSALVLDMGHRSARLRVVQDGHQLARYSMDNAHRFSGRALSKMFEEALVREVSLLEANGERAKTSAGDNNSNNKNILSDDAAVATDVNVEGEGRATISGGGKNKAGAFVDNFFSYSGSAAGAGMENNNICSAQLARRRIVQEAKHSVGLVCTREQQQLLFSTIATNNNDNEAAAAANSAHQSGGDTMIGNPAIFIAPDGREIKLSSKVRAECFERSLFQPAATAADGGVGDRGGGVGGDNAVVVAQQNVDDAAADETLPLFVKRFSQSLPADLRLSLPLLCCGGTSRTEGFGSRLQQELARVDTMFAHAVPRLPQDPCCQWRGASFLCAAPGFEKSWITDRAVSENGISRTRRSLP